MDQEVLSEKRVFSRRIGAFIIDYVIILYITLFFAFQNFGAADSFADFPLFMLIAIAGILCKDIFFGKSPGKLLFGLGVRDAADPKRIPPLHRLILRNIPILIWPVELIALSKNKERIRLGDKLAGTQVAATGKRSGVQTAIIIILAVLLSYSALFFFVTQIIKSDGSYNAAAEYIRSNKEILSITGTISVLDLSSGNVSYYNGSGNADLKFYIDGIQKDITVQIELIKTPDSEWAVQDVDY